MNSPLKSLIVFLTLVPGSVYGQFGRKSDFMDDYYFYRSYHPQKATEYKDVDGSPYLNDEFTEGILILKDSNAIKLPLRYNIYTDEMEYKHEGNNYVVGIPQMIEKVLLGETEFIYGTFKPKSGYFEIYETGNALLLRKKVVLFHPAEGPKPIEGTLIPAKFARESDVFYITSDKEQVIRISNLKTVLVALKDQEEKVKGYIKAEKIKNARKESLIKIVKFYNSLK